MFASDLLRLDTVILLLLEGEEAAGASELAEALGDFGLDLSSSNVRRELKAMQLKSYLSCTGWEKRPTVRRGMQVWELTETGRAVAAQRRGFLSRLLHDPPVVVSPHVQLGHAEGWQ